MCWNCSTPKSGLVKDSAEETSLTVAPPEQILAEVLRLQKEQQQTLSDIQSKVGCLFAYMIFGIVIAILAVLFSLGH